MAAARVAGGRTVRVGGRCRPRELKLSRLVDLDFVGDAVDACDVGIRRVALELVANVAFQGDPAAVDLDVNRVGRDVGVPDQGLQGDAADLVVVATIASPQVDLQFIVAPPAAVGVGAGGTPLAEPLDGPA